MLQHCYKCYLDVQMITYTIRHFKKKTKISARKQKKKTQDQSLALEIYAITIVLGNCISVAMWFYLKPFIFLILTMPDISMAWKSM